VRLSDREALRGHSGERQIDRFIEQRHDRRVLDEHERAVEEHWQVQERLHREERRKANRVKWGLFHQAQARRLRSAAEALASHHEEAAARLLEQPRIEGADMKGEA
jgi:hypothetical protein